MKSYKTKNMNLQLFAPSSVGPFYNYFYLDDVLSEAVMSSNVATPETIAKLYIVYHNSNIYGIGETQSEPTLNEILVNGQLILENVNPEYTGSFFTNPHGDGTEQDPHYLVEDEIVDAGYFADFTTYHTTKTSSGYSSTISLTNCTCNKSNETGLSGSYSATITANDGYYLSSVTSTLGTVEIATNLKTATITISDITTDFTISGIGTEIGKLDIILHPNNNGVTDYTKEILPKVKTASTLDINRLFRTEYTITKTIINGSASGDTNIWSEETAQVTITPDENYNLPSTITVINANNTYNNENGVVSLSNATGNVTISATCESAAWGGTDLTGTSWELKTELSNYSPNNYNLLNDDGHIENYSLNFISNNNNYNIFSFRDADVFYMGYGLLYFNDSSPSTVYNYNNKTYSNSNYRTIQITGGTDATNSTLINWLQSNATLISW